jgi:hypothetical protein
MRGSTGAVAAVLVALGSVPALSQDRLAPLRDPARAQVLVLGVFHFQDAGRDDYKPVFSFDIRSAQRQQELAEVIEQLAAWQPTRIGVELRPEGQPRLDSLLATYPGGGLDTLANEIYQVGFRLAKRLGHERVFAIDAPARYLDSAMSEAEWERRRRALRPGPLAATNWDARYSALYRADDSLKSVRPLRETLIAANNPERLAAGHGHYLVGNLLNGVPGEYLGADGFVSAWYNRNLRIYSNIVRLIRTPEERVLVIIGAGHAPILRQQLQAAPVTQLVEVGEVLRR